MKDTDLMGVSLKVMADIFTLLSWELLEENNREAEIKSGTLRCSKEWTEEEEPLVSSVY